MPNHPDPNYFGEHIYYKLFNKSFQKSSHLYILRIDKLESEVKKNRDTIITDLGAKQLSIVHQIHSDIVCKIEEAKEPGQALDGDAQVTNIPGIALGIYTADCVPVLLADNKNKVIGAAHAGWQGAIAHIASKTVNEMIEIGAELEHIKAYIGPAIHQESYEVSADYRGKFLAQSEENARFFINSKRADHFLFDLPGYVVNNLRESGISDIAISEDDTCKLPELYFSHRYSTLLGEKYKGNLLSVIMIK